MKRVVALAVAFLALSFLIDAPPASATTPTTTKTIHYGPFTIPGGSMDMPGMVQNSVRLAVPRPCVDCYVTGFQANLTYPDGRTANFDTGAMLHHVVFASLFHSDATCSGTALGLAGERFFASGNERTPVALPDGYGYRVHWYDTWNMLVDLMNMMPDSQTVYVDVTYTYAPTWTNLKPVKPVWLDIDNCGDAEYSVPAGYSDTQWYWNSSISGSVVYALGHVHDYGRYVQATDVTRAHTICKSSAGYGTKPAYQGHIESMSVCSGRLGRISVGDRIRLDSVYDGVPAPLDNVMGIMLAYVYRS